MDAQRFWTAVPEALHPVLQHEDGTGSDEESAAMEL